MKTALNHLAADQDRRLRVLNWNGDSLVLTRGHSPIRLPITQPKVPPLRVVQVSDRRILYDYAICSTERSGYWEAVVFASLAASGVVAILWSFFGN